MQGAIIAAIFLISCSFPTTRSEKCQALRPPDCKTELLNPSYHPHETICELYYRCDHGYESIFSCPPGQMFDLQQRICEPEESVICNRCESNRLSKIGGDQKEADSVFTGARLERKGDKDGNEREEKLSFFEMCPETPTCDISEVGMQKPYPLDCSKYIYCNEFGEAVLSSCSFDLQFSPHLGYCTNPLNAKCPYCEKPSTTTPIITTIPFCPETPACNVSEVGVQKPYPPDCTKYIYCDAFGQTILSTCSIDLHFSPHLGYCTSYDIAECPFCEEFVTSTPIVTTIPACPETPICNVSEVGIMKPYPPDCTKYIYCNALGESILSTCSIDLYFSPHLGYCTSYDIAECPFCEELVTSTPIVTTVPSCPDSPVCGPSDTGAMLPFPPDCRRYIYCSAPNSPQIRVCYKDWHFDHNLLHCDTASNVFCPSCTTEEPSSTTELITTIAVCPTTPDCSMDDFGALKPYPPDCSRYIYCDELANENIRICPNKYHFSSVLLHCTHIIEANCPYCEDAGDTPVLKFLKPISTKKTLEIKDRSLNTCEILPDCTVEDIGSLKPYPSNCSYFIYCDEYENEILSKCPNNLHFSPLELFCMEPQEAKCSECVTTTTTETITTTASICNEAPSCNDEDLGVIKPYPPDCTMYIYCDENANEILSKCPFDMHFSASLLYCTTPEEALCSKCEVSTTSISTSPTTIASCEVTPTCTISEIGLNKPYPPDCSMYIYCNEFGNEVISICPNDFHFSPINLFCMSPYEANCPQCEVASSSTYLPTTTEIITTIGICPEIPTCTLLEFGEVKPYPPDCSMYIYCDDKGNAILSKCAGDLHFSPTEFNCISPEEANCPICEQIPTSVASTSTTDMQTTVATCADIPTCSINEEGEVKPYPSDCSLYIYCNNNGIGIISQCPSGLHFSPVLLICTSPEEAECPICEVPATTALTSSTTEMISTTIGICPPTPSCEGASAGTLLPYPLDCNFYIFCDDTEAAEIVSCTPGLHFSPETLTCMLPEKANCPLCGLEETTPETTITDTTESSTITSVLPSSTTVFVCPSIPTCLGNETGVTKPYPPDCNFYIYCNGNIEGEIRKCARDLHFDTVSFKCIDPNVSNCEACDPVTSTTIVSTMSTTSQMTSDSTTIFSTTGSTLPPCADTPICSIFDAGVQKPYPPDCSKFLLCDIDGYSLTSCPSGLHFSPTNFSCLTPDLADCPLCTEVVTSTLTTVSMEFTTIELTTQEITTLEPTSSDLTTNPSLPPCAETPICTVFESGVKKPYPIDCTKYQMCSFGSPELLSCPPEEHFSPTMFICMNSTLANCPLCSEVITTTAVSPSTTTSEPTTQEETTTSETTEASTTLASSTLIPCVQTPTCSVFENGVKKPFPPDCEKFILCTFSSPIVESCPLGLHFSPTTYECVDPLIANCILCSETETTPSTTAPVTTEADTTTEEIASTDQPTTISTTLEPTTTTPAIPFCPPTPTCDVLEMGVLKPYPPNCEFFIYCNMGTAEIRKCKAGFAFNPVTNKCVVATEANCPLCISNK